MGEWTWPAYIGVLFGVGAFLVFLVPVLAFQYWHYGQFTVRRVLGVAALSVYGAALVAYTLLPLPATRGDWCGTNALDPQWQPFHFISDIAEATAGSGTLGTLTNRATLQVLFNVVLFLPWGMFVKGFAGKTVVMATVTGLAASLMIEATQATGVWGIYECAYRLGDVDDLMTNTAGALLGALLAPLVLWWMPRPTSFRSTAEQPRPVTNLRRWVGMAVDLAAFNTVGFALVISYRLFLVTTGRELPQEPTVVEAVLLALVPALVVFFLPAWHGSGASIGQRALRLIPVWSEDVSRGRKLGRAATIGGSYAVLLFASHWPTQALWTDAAGGLAQLLLLAAFVAVPLTRQRGLSGLATGAVMHDERAGKTHTVPAGVMKTGGL